MKHIFLRFTFQRLLCTYSWPIISPPVWILISTIIWSVWTEHGPALMHLIYNLLSVDWTWTSSNAADLRSDLDSDLVTNMNENQRLSTSHSTKPTVIFWNYSRLRCSTKYKTTKLNLENCTTYNFVQIFPCKKKLISTQIYKQKANWNINNTYKYQYKILLFEI